MKRNLILLVFALALAFAVAVPAMMPDSSAATISDPAVEDSVAMQFDFSTTIYQADPECPTSDPDCGGS